MMKVGLTGGIGSGKTTVAGMFSDLGIPVYDSDREAKSLMVHSPELKAAILALFGDKAYNGQELNRRYISDQVFKDGALLEKLNQLVHPAVRRHFKKWMKEQTAPYVVQEAAILFENGAYKEYDAMVLVWAPLEARIQRITARDGASRQDILDRMRHQMDDSEKSALADYIIENINLEHTALQVAEIHEELLQQASRKLI